MTTESAEHAKTSSKVARNRRWVRIVLVVVGVVLLLCLLAAAALGAFVNSGKAELLADNEKGNPRQSISRNGVKYVLNEDMVSIAVIGTDRLYGYVANAESEGHSDAIMLVAYDTATGKMTLVNVPRNLYVEFKFWYPDGLEASTRTFLASAYAYGENDAQSSEVVCGAVSDIFSGLPVENYVTLLESCIAPLTEAMGGVTVTAIQDVPTVGIKKGETYTLQGEQALRYVQWRNIWEPTSPADRMKRQHDFAQAFLHQSVDAIKKNPAIIGQFYDIITDPQYMTTNLKANELAYLVSSAVLNGVKDLDMVTVPYTEDRKEGGTLVAYLPDEQGIIDLLLDIYYKPAE